MDASSQKSRAKELLSQLENNIDCTFKLVKNAEKVFKKLQKDLLAIDKVLESQDLENSDAQGGQEGLRLNDRVVWMIKDGQPELGTVKWTGMMHDGLVAGVEFDEAIGNSDGNLDGRKLFHCKPRHGRFVLVRELILWTDFSGEPV